MHVLSYRQQYPHWEVHGYFSLFALGGTFRIDRQHTAQFRMLLRIHSVLLRVGFVRTSNQYMFDPRLILLVGGNPVQQTHVIKLVVHLTLAPRHIGRQSVLSQLY